MSEEVDVNVTDVSDVVAPSESEVKARRLGWVPQDEWKGNPDHWRDADEFLYRGEEIHGYLKENLNKLHSEISQRDQDIAEMRAAMEEFRKYHNETEARAYKRAIDELKALKAEAIENRDGSKVIELDEQIDQLKEAQAQKSVKEDPVRKAEQINQDYLEWLPKNQWYVQDKELAAFAEHIGNLVHTESPNLVGKPFLEEVTKRVKNMVPEKFDNPNRQHSAVATGSDSRPTGGKKKKTYNDLPAEAKAACDQFVKRGWITQEQYLKEYDWE